MSESSRDTFLIIGKLVLISIVAALLLGITYIPTSQQLEENIIAAQKVILSELMPEAQNFEPVESDVAGEDGQREILYYRAVDSSGNIIGYAFFKQQGGAQGPIVVAGAVDASFANVLGMNVLSHEETPGLGSKITSPDFRSQFQGIAVSKLGLSSSGGSIDSITGATISSKAVVDAMNSKIDEIESAEA